MANCPYCNEPRKLHDSEDGADYMQVQEDGMLTVTVDGEYENPTGYFRINNCPMCGRELKEAR